MDGGRHGREGGAGEDTEALLARLEAERAVRQVRSARYPVHARADALAVEAAARRAALGTGPAELALGDGLARLLRRGGLMKLGRSGVGDLGREDLGLSDRCAQRLRRNAEKLRVRPALRAAILSGEVTMRKAEVLLERTPARQDAYWAARARTDTVRGLQAATRAGAPEDSGEDWHAFEAALPPGEKHIVQTAMEWARLLQGGVASKERQLEAILMEFSGGFPPPRELPDDAPSRWLVPAEAVPEQVVPPPPPDEGPFDPHACLAELQALAKERKGTDERLRRACLLVRDMRAYRLVGFNTFDLWCSEALGISPRTIRQLVALERRLQALPELREAVRTGVLTLEKARQVARHAKPADVGRRIEEAAALPALDTKRQEDAEADRRMWDAGTLRLSLSESVHRLWVQALYSARSYFPGRTPGEVLVYMAAHCLLTWRHDVVEGLKKSGEAMVRDDWLCQVPGCSHRAEHLHHIWWKSRGGPTTTWNLLGLCVAHHLQGVHQGHIEVSGRADDVLTFVVRNEVMLRSRRPRLFQSAA